MPFRSVLLGLAALVSSACGAADAPDEPMRTATEILPNGGMLVQHTPAAAGVPVTWRLEEDLRIGALEGGGPEQFGRVGGLAVGANGEIVVLDAQAQDLRIFGPDGAYLRTLGGKGAGPGEMEGVNGVVFGPDGLLRVPDGRNNRISFFDLEAGFVRSHPYQPMFLTWMWDGVVDAEGNAWSIHWIPSAEPGERGRTAYVGYDPAGAVVDTLPHPADERDTMEEQPGLWQVERNGRPMASLGVPFYPRQQHVLTSGLRVWSTYEGDPAYRLKRWTPAGDTTLVLRLDRPLQPSDRALADSIARGWEEEFDISLDRSKIPDVAPAIISHFLDDDGRLWVQASTADQDSVRTFDVFDAQNGDWLGTLATTLPILTAPRPVVRGDRVWAVVTDEMDVQYVVSGLLRGAGGAGDDGPSSD